MNFKEVMELMATFASGLFAGAALYINAVEHPARMSCGISTAIKQWGPSYKRAAVMQGLLAVVASLSAVIAWIYSAELSWLIGGILMFLNVPFTLIVIRPINQELLSVNLENPSEKTLALLQSWTKLHAVRTAMSITAFFLFLFTD